RVRGGGGRLDPGGGDVAAGLARDRRARRRHGVEEDARAQREDVDRPPREAQVLAGAERHDPGAGEPPPELPRRHRLARHGDALRAEAGHVGVVLLGRKAAREDGEEILAAVERRESLEDAHGVLAAAPDVRDVGDVDLIRRGAEATERLVRAAVGGAEELIYTAD